MALTHLKHKKKEPFNTVVHGTLKGALFTWQSHFTSHGLFMKKTVVFFVLLGLEDWTHLTRSRGLKDAGFYYAERVSQKDTIGCFMGNEGCSVSGAWPILRIKSLDISASAAFLELNGNTIKKLCCVKWSSLLKLLHSIENIQVTLLRTVFLSAPFTWLF